MKISKIRENARTALAGKWGKGACISLAYLAFSLVIGFIAGLFSESKAITVLIELANLIITVPISLGLTFVAIKLKRNEDVKAFDFLSLGFSNFGKAWGICLNVLVRMILPILVLIAVLVVFLGIEIYLGNSEAAGANTTISRVFGLISIALYIVVYIWAIARALLYSLTSYIAYDNTDMSSSDVAKESARLMKGNRVKIFLLSLSFIGWIFLAAFTLGIGYIWLMPYMAVAEVCFYDYLIGKKEANNAQDNEEAVAEM